MGRVVVGVDMGGTNLRFGLVDEKGAIVARSRAKTASGEGVGLVISRIEKGVSALIKKAHDGGDEVVGVGVGVPGIIEAKKGAVRFSPNLPGWVDVPLRDSLVSRLSVPVFVENDANAYALGEAVYGAGRGTSSLVCFTLGTGVGGGIILGGDVWRGADGMAGEVGHMTVEPEGLDCPCGSRGCLERYSSATAVVEATLTALRDKKRSSLSKTFREDPASITTEAVARAARSGDRLSAHVYGEAGRYLGIAAANLINLLNVEMIILGGGMAGAWGLFIGPLREEVRLRAFDVPAKRCRIVRGRLGDDAGILGAAGLVFKGRRA